MNYTIGVLGGMGTYATIHLFKQYASVFPAQKEWERPRLIIDNRCTMPSRVLAYLNNEKRDELVSEMADSLLMLIHAGCSRILLACNTSHLFIPEILNKVPEAKDTIVNIIDACADKISSDGVKQTFLLATEGTIESEIYQKTLQKKGISCVVPDSIEYSKLRECIEAVKQNKHTDNSKALFLEMINRYDTCVLGCTELPILYELYRDNVFCTNIYDPLYIALNILYGEYIGKGNV